jgi:hypothetical protein
MDGKRDLFASEADPPVKWIRKGDKKKKALRDYPQSLFKYGGESGTRGRCSGTPVTPRCAAATRFSA